MVTFELFVRPAIRKMMGHQRCFRRTVPVRAAAAIRLGPTLQHFLRAVVVATDAGYDVRLTGPQGSGILTSMVQANALLIVPQGQHQTPEGARLSALLLDDPNHVVKPPW
jgi:molybdopterin molybdotransferase